MLSEILPARALAPEEVKEMLVPVLDALTELHGHGLVHGRLRPSNILVVNDELKLSADCVQLAGDSVDDSHALNIYDAPERAEGLLTPASDIWSLGVLIFESLTESTPDWNRSTNRDVQISDSVPQPYATVISACLRVDPARRAKLNEIRSRLGLAEPAAAALPSASAPTPKPAQAPPRHAAQAEPKSAAKPEPRADSQDEPSPVTEIDPMPSAAEPRRSSRHLSGFDDEPELRRKQHGGVLLVIGLVLISAAVLLWSRWHGTLPATKSNDQPPAQFSAVAPVTPETQLQTPPTTQATPDPDKQTPPVGDVPPDASAPPAPIQSNAGAVKGSVAQRVMPEVLPASNRSIQGKVNVVVRLNVSPAGEVTDANFESAGPSKYFARVAMEAARKWKFTPAHANGQPIASTWALHFVFTRENTDVTPTQAVP